MERELTQEEIDAMVRAARGRPTDSSVTQQRSVRPCSFRQAGQLTGEQVRVITGLHEGFARSLTQSLGAYLRVAFEVALVSVEQLAYSEWLGRVPEVTYMMSFHVRQINASAAMQIDHSLVFPLVDILLGGTGQCESLTREVTEIEEQIMEGVAKIIGRELETSWTPLGFSIDLSGRQAPAHMQHFLASTEKTLCLSLEIKLAQATGMMNLVFPVAISNTLLRKFSTDWSRTKERAANPTGLRLRETMMDCSFQTVLGTSKIKLPVERVLDLAPGKICDLGIPVRNPVSLMIAGREAFGANPVRHGRQRAAQIRQITKSSKEGRTQ